MNNSYLKKEMLARSKIQLNSFFVYTLKKRLDDIIIAFKFIKVL